jgi:DNA-binding NtrC family response regulator
MVGRSSVIETVRDLIAKVAPTEATVLISGESGSGKELVAQAIHARSVRSSGPFLGINCGALPPTLIESELFGFERGSFTGANRSQKGKAALADGGILFLDEIGELSPFSQTKLLRTYRWPGNVREVRNFVEALFIDPPTGPIRVRDIPAAFARLHSTYTRTGDDERMRIMAALEKTDWNKAEAAKTLQWSRMTLYRKLTKYQVSRSRPGGLSR